MHTKITKKFISLAIASSLTSQLLTPITTFASGSTMVDDNVDYNVDDNKTTNQNDNNNQPGYYNYPFNENYSNENNQPGYYNYPFNKNYSNENNLRNSKYLKTNYLKYPTLISINLISTFLNPNTSIQEKMDLLNVILDILLDPNTPIEIVQLILNTFIELLTNPYVSIYDKFMIKDKLKYAMMQSIKKLNDEKLANPNAELNTLLVDNIANAIMKTISKINEYLTTTENLSEDTQYDNITLFTLLSYILSDTIINLNDNDLNLQMKILNNLNELKNSTNNAIQRNTTNVLQQVYNLSTNEEIKNSAKNMLEI